MSRELSQTGLIVLPSLLDAQQLKILNHVAGQVCSGIGPEVVRTTAGEVQSVYGVHHSAPQLLSLVRELPVADLICELIGEPGYVYQSQLHLKPISSQALSWHQDYVAFEREDGLVPGRGVSIILFADDVQPHNGPMFVIPGSHRGGSHPTEWTSTPELAESSHEDLAGQFVTTSGLPEQLAQRFGEQVLTAPAGSVALMDLHLMHASGVSLLNQRRGLFHFSVVGSSFRRTNGRRPVWVSDPAGPLLR